MRLLATRMWRAALLESDAKWVAAREIALEAAQLKYEMKLLFGLDRYIHPDENVKKTMSAKAIRGWITKSKGDDKAWTAPWGSPPAIVELTMHPLIDQKLKQLNVSPMMAKR